MHVCDYVHMHEACESIAATWTRDIDVRYCVSLGTRHLAFACNSRLLKVLKVALSFECESLLLAAPQAHCRPLTAPATTRTHRDSMSSIQWLLLLHDTYAKDFSSTCKLSHFVIGPRGKPDLLALYLIANSLFSLF